MMNGLWTVHFDSTLNRFGQGVLVLNDGKLLGGDEGYYYSGTYKVTDSKIYGDINVTRYDSEYKSVIGDLDDFHFNFSGKVNDDYHFEAVAPVNEKENLYIKIKGNKKVDM